MRILHVVPSFGFGGMEKVICAVIESTAIHYEHTVLPLDGCAVAAEWITNSGTEFIEFAKPLSRRLFFTSLYEVLRISSPDLLMTYNWGATDAIWLGRFAGIKNIVHHEHGFNADEGTNTLWRRNVIRSVVYRLVSKLVVVSHELEEMIACRFRVSKERITRIPNGIDTSLYVPDVNERQRMRRALGYRDTDLVLGFSGRLDRVKNLDLLLDVFGLCMPHNYPVRLLIVGNGPEKKRIEARCRAEGLESYVRFVGQHKQVLPYLRAMDVFLLTSLREQMPLTVLEAMGVGLPVIATGVGELPYIIDDGINGFVRDLKTPMEEFAELLRSCLLRSSNRKRVGDAAREKVNKEYKIGTMVQRYAQLIQNFDSDRAIPANSGK